MPKFKASKIYLALVTVLILLSVSPARALERDAAFEFPVRAYNDGKYRVAVRGFSRFIENYPDDERIQQVELWKVEALIKLQEFKRAYNELFQFYETNPGYKPGQVVHRIAFLAEKLGREKEVVSLLTPEVLEKQPRLQNYLVKWLWSRRRVEELASRLMMLPAEKLTGPAEEFLGHHDMGKEVEKLREKLSRGDWNSKIKTKLDELPRPLRRNVIALVGRNNLEQNKIAAVLELGRNLPEDWQSSDFLLYRAEAALRNRQFSLADRIYRELRQRGDYFVESTYGLARIVFDRGKFRDVVDLLEELGWSGAKTELAVEGLRLLGNAKFALGDFPAAADFYQRALEKAGATERINEIRYRLAWSYYRADEFNEAYSQFELVRSGDGEENFEVSKMLGRTALELKNYKAAEQHYEAALDQVPEESEKKIIRYEMAQLYYETGRVKAAFDELLALSKSGLEDELEPAVNFALGRAALERNRYTLAWSVFQKDRSRLVEQFPVEFRFFAGEAAFQAGEYDKAREYFQQVVDKYPESDFARAARRMSFRSEIENLDPGDREQQQRIRKKVEAADTGNKPSLLQAWADSLYDQGKLSQAREIYLEVLRQTSADEIFANTLAALVEIELELGNREKALEYLEEHREELPRHPRVAAAIYSLTWDFYREGRLAEVEKWGNRYLDLFDGTQYRAEVLFMLGEKRRHEENFAEAIEYYTASLEISPRAELKNRIYFRLGQVHLVTENHSRAAEYLNQLSGIDPDFVSSGRLLLTRARAAYGQGEYEKALKLLGRITKPGKRAKMLRAKALFQRDKLAEARTVLEELDVSENDALKPERDFWLGKVARANGNVERAEELWYQVYYIYNEWVQRDRLIYRLAELARSQGDEREAEELVRRLKEEHQESAYLEKVQ